MRSFFIRLMTGMLVFCGILILLPTSAAPTSQFDIPVTPSEQLFLNNVNVIRKCVDPYWMPLEGIKGGNQHVGVIADILDLIESRIAVPIELVPTTSWVESMEKLKRRECDIVTSDIQKGVTPDHYIKTVPFMNHRNVYITRDDEPLQLDFSLITGKTIGVPKGYPTIKLIKDQYGEVNFVEVNDVDEGLLKVSKGELYAFTELLPICSYSIQKQGLTNLKVAGHLDISFPTVMAVRADMPHLVSILNKAFENLDSNDVNQFLSRWLKIEYDMRWDWQRLLFYGLLGLFIFIIILYWNRKLYSLNRELDKANAELALTNQTDTLTGLKNRYFLDEQLPGLIRIANRNKLSLAVSILDMDNFKRFNDMFGHSVGDKCLVSFAECVQSVFKRESDFSVRYGGDEFVIICIGLSFDEFKLSLEKLRAQAEQIDIEDFIGKDAKVTVSSGFIYYPCSPDNWSEGLIKRADDLLYTAKAMGRNRVMGNSDFCAEKNA